MRRSAIYVAVAVGAWCLAATFTTDTYAQSPTTHESEFRRRAAGAQTQGAGRRIGLLRRKQAGPPRLRRRGGQPAAPAVAPPRPVDPANGPVPFPQVNAGQ